MNLDYVSIGRRIKETRKAKHITQKQLAEEIEVARTYMSTLEAGNKKVSLPTIAAIAKYLDTPLDYLVFGDTDEKDTEEDLLAFEIIKSFTPEQKELAYERLNALRSLFLKYKLEKR